MEKLEGLKEFGRVVLLAIVSYLLTEGVLTGLLDIWLGVKIDPTQKILVVGLITAALKAVDKWLHERGKDSGNNGYLGVKGITGF